jgi:integrase
MSQQEPQTQVVQSTRSSDGQGALAATTLTRPTPSIPDDLQPKRRAGRAHKRGDGEGTIYLDAKAKLWRGELMVGRKVDGRRDVRKVSAKTRSECQKRVAAVKQEAAGGLIVDAHRLTVGHALVEWLRDGEIRGLRPNTLASYGRITRSYVSPRLGHHKLAELRPEHVRRLLADLVQRGLAPATVRYARVVVHGALQLALRQERVARNVAAVVQPPRRKRPQLTPPTPEEAARLLDAASQGGDRLAALWTVALYGGCRPSEMLALRWKDVDWESGRITVRNNLVHVAEGVPTLAEPKTDRGRRLKLDDEAMTSLRMHRARQNVERLAFGPDYQDYDLVFSSHTGTPLIYRNVTRAFKQLLVRAGLPPTVRFYDLRHANATAMLKAGVHPKSAAERLGHSGTALFMDTYAHMLEELDTDAAARLGQAIRGRRPAV